IPLHISYARHTFSVSFFFFSSYFPPRALHSFPTRRSSDLRLHVIRHIRRADPGDRIRLLVQLLQRRHSFFHVLRAGGDEAVGRRSEEHTSELQSQSNLVCRLLLEKKKKKKKTPNHSNK